MERGLLVRVAPQGKEKISVREADISSMQGKVLPPVQVGDLPLRALD
jgi:hypothetical protein